MHFILIYIGISSSVTLLAPSLRRPTQPHVLFSVSLLRHLSFRSAVNKLAVPESLILLQVAGSIVTIACHVHPWLCADKLRTPSAGDRSSALGFCCDSILDGRYVSSIGPCENRSHINHKRNQRNNCNEFPRLCCEPSLPYLIPSIGLTMHGRSRHVLT